MESESHGDIGENVSLEIKNSPDIDQIVDVNEAQTTAVIFTLDNQYYAFKGKDVSEILQFTKINFVPGCPDYILGVVNLRGDIESVISLHELLDNIKSDITRKSRIILADKQGLRSGILVDSVEDVVDIPESSFNTSLYDHNKKFVVGETFYQDNHVAIIDVGKLFIEIRV